MSPVKFGFFQGGQKIKGAMPPLLRGVGAVNNHAKDGAQVTLRGRMFHRFGPITAKDVSSIDFCAKSNDLYAKINKFHQETPVTSRVTALYIVRFLLGHPVLV